jgi:hypothetical protein
MLTQLASLDTAYDLAVCQSAGAWFSIPDAQVCLSIMNRKEFRKHPHGRGQTLAWISNTLLVNVL